MDKRKFLKVSGIVGTGVIMSPLMSCNPSDSADNTTNDKEGNEAAQNSSFSPEQSALSYNYNALEPYIDARTMEIHFSKHHAGYVKKLKGALSESPDFKVSNMQELLANVQGDQLGIRNNGGGHFNHSLFWKCMEPGGSKTPSGKLAEAVDSAFGSFELFKAEFFKAAKTRFGSGWGWLNVDASGKLFISSTPNQDNPLMKNIVANAGTPILGVDVWEHAYYLKYQNLRGDYINAFMDLINWDNVAANFAAV